MQRITYPAACVLQAIHVGRRYGFSIMDATELPSGTVYQALRRFERDGLVRSRWEKPGELGAQARPRRRYYELTRDGQRALVVAAGRYRRHQAVFGPAGSP